MRRFVLWPLAVVVCAYLVAPVFVVLPLSFNSSRFLEFPPPGYTLEWYGKFFSDPTWTSAVMRSVYVATTVILLSILIGMASAYALTRGRHWFLTALEPLFVLPMIVPVVVFAAGVYILMLQLGFVGSMWVVILVHTILALPFVVLTIGAALRTTDYRLELAAQTLGASRLQAFLRVTLPLVAPAVISATILAGLVSLDETIAALFLSPDGSPTLPVRMYSSIRYELNPVVPVAATVMLGLTLVFGISGLLLRRLLARCLLVKSRYGA